MSVLTSGIMSDWISTGNNPYTQYTVATIFSAVGTTTYVVPAGVTSLVVECLGGGGAAMSFNLRGNSGPGAGGGGYARSTISVTPGQSYKVYVGAGGTSDFAGLGDEYYRGLSSYFGATSSTETSCTVRGAGGGAYDLADYTNNPGGGSLNLPNIGDVTHLGGIGGSNGFTPLKTGSGGSGAGTNAAGNVGSTNNGLGSTCLGGAGIAEHGGAGGNGYPLDSVFAHGLWGGDGQPGQLYGGGGGGCGSIANASAPQPIAGGAGAQGLVIISYLAGQGI